MTLSIKNDRYVFLTRLDLIFSMSLWKEFQLLQILNNQSIKHLIFNWTYLMWKWGKTYKISEMSWVGRFVICLKCEILITDTWNKYIKKSEGMVNLFFYCKFNVNMPII